MCTLVDYSWKKSSWNFWKFPRKITIEILWKFTSDSLGICRERMIKIMTIANGCIRYRLSLYSYWRFARPDVKWFPSCLAGCRNFANMAFANLSVTYAWIREISIDHIDNWRQRDSFWHPHPHIWKPSPSFTEGWCEIFGGETSRDFMVSPPFDDTPSSLFIIQLNR